VESVTMLERSEFQTVGTAKPKLLKVKVVWTHGTDSKLVLAKHRERDN